MILILFIRFTRSSHSTKMASVLSQVKFSNIFLSSTLTPYDFNIRLVIVDWPTAKPKDGEDVAAVVHVFYATEPTVKKLVLFKELEQVLPSFVQPAAVVWIHISDTDVLLSIMKHMRVEEAAFLLFKDTSYRAHSKVTEDNAIILSTISLCLIGEDFICGKKMVFYQKDNLLISIEQRVLTTIEADMEEESQLSHTPSNPLRKANVTSFFSAKYLVNFFK